MFEEFEKYIYVDLNLVPDYPANRFHLISVDQIEKLEKRLGFSIPSQLKQFYNEIGFGALNTSKDGKSPSPGSNIVVDPVRLADLYFREDYEWLAEEICDEGEMPFFDCGDQLYFVMKPHSDNPNAVYWTGLDTPMVDSFEEFMKKLHVNPIFYLDKPYYPY